MERSSSLEKRTVEALRLWQPAFAAELETAAYDPRVVPVCAKDNSTTVVLAPSERGKPIQLHSLYNPTREAMRQVDDMAQVATVIRFGCGGLHVPRAYLDTYPTSSMLLVEFSLEVIRTIIGHIDIVRYVRSGRMRFAVDEKSLAEELANIHHSSIRDGILFSRLRPWTEFASHRNAFESLADSAEAAVRSLAEEQVGMTSFGRRWLAHTIQNSFRINWAAIPKKVEQFSSQVQDNPVRILAAGPSLDRWLENHSDASGAKELVVDTAAPAIAARNRSVDGIVILDPQGWNALHFRPRRDERRRYPAPRVIFDIGTPPLPSADGVDFLPLGSDHPLHRLLRASGFPLIPSPNAENVTIAAVDLAQRFGCNAVEVVGADLSYPAGVTYARDTYHYTIADARAHRLFSGETFFASMVYPTTVCNTPQKGDRPVFKLPGFQQVRSLLETRLADRDIAPFDLADKGPIDVSAFWRDHIATLVGVEERLTGADKLATIEILVALGPGGRAHLPMIAALNHLSLRRQEEKLTVSQRLLASIREIRAFIFFHLCRYSN